MKKILALILAFVMIVGVLVGCNKTSNEVVEDTTPTTVPTDSTEPSQEPTYNENNQQLWEDVFLNNKYKFASNSFKLTSGCLSVVYLTDGTAQYFKMEGDLEEGKIGSGIAAIDDETIYYQQFLNDEVTWSKCINIDNENVNVDTTIDDAKTDNNDFEAALKTVSKVEYVESVGDVDKVIVYYTPVDEDVDGTVVYDVSFEIEYNGAKGIYRYTERDEDGMVSSSTMSTDSIDNFVWMDWDFDKDTLTLTKDEETIQCVIVEDHMADNEEELVPIEVYINSKTYKISKMVMDVTETSLSMIEYVTCNNLIAELNLPETFEEVDLEEAMMEFAFTMLGIAFGGLLS